ncbi:hypothetical protein M9Y10_039326, partial [Tritrichomonas musculus]
NTEDEHIPLPIETVYNSNVDALRTTKRYERGTKIDHHGNKHFNRLYFKYPPEWKTSNVGEKINGVRKMSIHWRDGKLNFMLYIRKYNQILMERSIIDAKNQLIIDNCEDEELKNNMKIFGIPISIYISSNDTWNDIKTRIMNLISQENLYNYIYRRLKSIYTVPSNLLPKLNQLDQIKDNYYAMLEESFDLIGEQIPFYLEPNDVEIIKEIKKNDSYLKFVSPQNEKYNKQYYIDFMITDLDNITGDLHSVYKKIYRYENIENGIELSGKTLEDPEPLDRGEWFDPYTANFFNIGLSVYKNDLNYVTKFHRILELKNVMTDLQCEVAASFATQSNHNIIGKTNEIFCPIKYYKLNDNDETFWIEFYDRDDLNVPVSFNDNVTFVMDMVFLQNRKLLYS